MQPISLIDTHCDTAFELYHRSQELSVNNCHISLEKASAYRNYAQFFAIWANKRLNDDECYDDFLKISDNLLLQIEKNKNQIEFVTNFTQMKNAWAQGKRAAFLAVEDARILGGDISRLDILHKRGVKYLTLLWGGDTCIGSSHDMNGGLTDFGRQVVHSCFDIGIIPDVSHANERVTDEVSAIAFKYNKPFIASHSNCYEQFAHTRNLREKHLKAIISLGGMVGLNLCPYHVKEASQFPCTIDDVVAHVDKYMELGAGDVLGLGCDLDGTDLPNGISGIGDIYKIADRLICMGYSELQIEKIFYKNFYNFIEKNF